MARDYGDLTVLLGQMSAEVPPTRRPFVSNHYRGFEDKVRILSRPIKQSHPISRMFCERGIAVRGMCQFSWVVFSGTRQRAAVEGGFQIVSASPANQFHPSGGENRSRRWYLEAAQLLPEENVQGKWLKGRRRQMQMQCQRIIRIVVGRARAAASGVVGEPRNATHG